MSDDAPILPPSIRLASQSSAERRKKEEENKTKSMNDLDLTSEIFKKKKEGESLFLLSLDQSGDKIADEMNPILGMYRMPTPAYYLRGVYPMGDLKCIVKMKSNECPVSVPSHMDKIIREWIRDGVKESMFGPPKEEKKSKSSSDGYRPYGRKGDIPENFQETATWQYIVDDEDPKASSWADFHEDDQSLIEVAWRDRESSVRISNEGGETFRVDLGDGDLEKQEFTRISIKTGETLQVRRLPGSCVYANMPQGVRVEVMYKKKWYPGEYHDYNEWKNKFRIQCDSDRSGVYTLAIRKNVRRMKREELPEYEFRKSESKETEETTKEDESNEEECEEEKKKKEIEAAVAAIDTDYEFDFFFVVSDVSPIIKKHHASIWNLVMHPWCFPKVTLGSPDAMNIIPIGLFTTMDPTKCNLKEADQRNGLTVNDLCFMKVHVHKHPKEEWAMCCSPDNAAFRLQRGKKMSFFWSATIMGLPDGPDRGLSSHWGNDSKKKKPKFSDDKKLEKYDNSCFHGAEQIQAHRPKRWRAHEALRIIRGKPKPSVDGKPAFDLPSWTGLDFDKQGNDIAITFDCLDPMPFRGTMILGGNTTDWEVQYSDDNKTYKTAAKFPKTLTKGWDELDWEDVGSHRYWRYKCLNNPDRAMDYYKGVEWYVAKKDDDGTSAPDEGKKKKSAKPKIRVCISLQWLLQKRDDRLSGVFDSARNLGDLVNGLCDHFGPSSPEMYDFMHMLSSVTKWKPATNEKSKREKFMKDIKTRGFQKAKKGRETRSSYSYSSSSSYGGGYSVSYM